MLLERVVKRQRVAETPNAHAQQQQSDESLLVQFCNAKLVQSAGLKDDDLWMQGGSLVDPQVRFWERRSAAADRRFDCRGLLLAPGCIDIMMFGAFGIDFSSLGEEGAEAAAEAAMQTVCSRLPALGVTAFCPAIRPCAPATYARLLERLVQPKPARDACHARVLGVHLDGPFFCEAHAAEGADGAGRAHLRGSIDRDVAQALRTTFGRADGLPKNVALMTMAPELPGALQAIDRLTSSGVIVGIGRTAATLAECRGALHSGARLVTNVLSCMPPFHHRDPGPTGLLADRSSADGVQQQQQQAAEEATHDGTAGQGDDDVSMGAYGEGLKGGGGHGGGRIFFSMAVSGQHASSVNLAHSTHPDGLILLSEGKEAAEALPSCARRLWECSGADNPAAALLCCSAHPAALLGLGGAKGTLAAGADADLVLLDPHDLRVRACFVGGRLAWADPESHGAMWYH